LMMIFAHSLGASQKCLQARREKWLTQHPIWNLRLVTAFKKYLL